MDFEQLRDRYLQDQERKQQEKAAQELVGVQGCVQHFFQRQHFEAVRVPAIIILLVSFTALLYVFITGVLSRRGRALIHEFIRQHQPPLLASLPTVGVAGVFVAGVVNTALNTVFTLMRLAAVDAHLKMQQASGNSSQEPMGYFEYQVKQQLQLGDDMAWLWSILPYLIFIFELGGLLGVYTLLCLSQCHIPPLLHAAVYELLLLSTTGFAIPSIYDALTVLDFRRYPLLPLWVNHLLLCEGLLLSGVLWWPYLKREFSIARARIEGSTGNVLQAHRSEVDELRRRYHVGHKRKND